MSVLEKAVKAVQNYSFLLQFLHNKHPEILNEYKKWTYSSLQGEQVHSDDTTGTEGVDIADGKYSR